MHVANYYHVTNHKYSQHRISYSYTIYIDNIYGYQRRVIAAIYNIFCLIEEFRSWGIENTTLLNVALRSFNVGLKKRWSFNVGLKSFNFGFTEPILICYYNDVPYTAYDRSGVPASEFLFQYNSYIFIWILRKRYCCKHPEEVRSSASRSIRSVSRLGGLRLDSCLKLILLRYYILP